MFWINIDTSQLHLIFKYLAIISISTIDASDILFFLVRCITHMRQILLQVSVYLFHTFILMNNKIDKKSQVKVSLGIKGTNFWSYIQYKITFKMRSRWNLWDDFENLSIGVLVSYLWCIWPKITGTWSVTSLLV